MRPDTDPDFVAFLGDERKADPVSYDSEYGAEFRRDIESFTSLEQVEAVMVTGRSMLTYQEGVAHWAFIDTAGGGEQDSVALCITRREKDRAVVRRVDEWKPPFAAPAVAVEVVGVLQEYNLTTVTGDAFSGQTWPSVLKDAGLASYVVADKSKSDIFHDFLPLLNGQLVELLDRKAGTVQERAISQLLALERTVSGLSPGPQNAERSRQGRRDAEETGGLTKDVEPSETARQGRGAASRAARFPLRQCGMGQRRGRFA